MITDPSVPRSPPPHPAPPALTGIDQIRFAPHDIGTDGREGRPAAGWTILLLWLIAATPAHAFPDGAPWEATRGEVCHACHFDRPVAVGSSALAVEGLPLSVEPGEEYALTIRLDDPAMRSAGFLISVTHGPEEAGRMRALDGRSEVRGARARATAAGSAPGGEGESAWTVLWRAPDPLRGPIAFKIWSVAGNGDHSPLGDSVHELTVEIREARARRCAPDRRAASTASC